MRPSICHTCSGSFRQRFDDEGDLMDDEERAKPNDLNGQRSTPLIEVAYTIVAEKRSMTVPICPVCS